MESLARCLGPRRYAPHPQAPGQGLHSMPSFFSLLPSVKPPPPYCNSKGVSVSVMLAERAGVVLAQRLEQLAAANGVVVQGTVSETVPKRMPFEFRSLGEQTLKGFDEPVRAFAASLKDAQTLPDPDSLPKEIETELPTQNDLTDSTQTPPPQKSSLAVLPFSTVGHSADTEEIADGITDVLINTLSRTGMSEIADRASTFSYKGKTPS